VGHRAAVSFGAAAVLAGFAAAVPADGELAVTALGPLGVELSARDEREGTAAKEEAVRRLLGPDAERVAVRHLGADLGGNTSVRNEVPLKWKAQGYFQRNRDLGQVFTADRAFTLDAVVLRTGNGRLAFLPGAAGASVFLQLFEVSGTPSIDDNGTPPGRDATHGFSKNHRCDDFLRGVTYSPVRVARGGVLPDLGKVNGGRLVYMKWDLAGGAEIRLEGGRRYAFMVGFSAPAPERGLTLANRNNAASQAPPALDGREDLYHGGWGLRREGNGKVPPTMVPGEVPPGDPDLARRLREESEFPAGEARFAIPPTCDGYPDVDTYRDLEFYILAR